MENVVIILRALQLYSHHAHNLVAKGLFFQDHDYLGELYPAYEADYDSVVERIIGLGQPIDLLSIDKKAMEMIEALPLNVPENLIYFQKIIELEQYLQQAIQMDYPNVSIGSQQLIGEIANQSEMRLYKLKQRVKK